VIGSVVGAKLGLLKRLFSIMKYQHLWLYRRFTFKNSMIYE
jgi:hypothetical protein